MGPSPPWPPPAYPAPTRPADGLAIAALVLGIVGILTAFVVVFNLLALVFGLIACRRTRRWQTPGFGMAMSGVILGTIGLVIGGGMWAAVLVEFGAGGTTSTSQLRPGQCLAPPVDAETAHVESCRDFHRFEVLASLNDPTLPPEYPGAEVLVERARNRCDSLVVDDVGGPEEAAHLSLRVVVPSVEQWAADGIDGSCACWSGPTGKTWTNRSATRAGLSTIRTVSRSAPLPRLR